MESIKGESQPGWLERTGTAIDDVRAWLRNSVRLGVLMGKGAYLSFERRRSFQRLGRRAYERLNSGALQDNVLETHVQQIARLTKKLELEERLLRSIRFGEKRGRKSSSPDSSEPPPQSEGVI